MQMFGRGAAQHDKAAALVYADAAQAWGYLRPQRTLTDQEYSDLRSQARPWTASVDHTVPDLVGAFGPPSLWRPDYNPLYPLSLYVSSRAGDPLIAFDFWQDTDWSTPPLRPRLGPEPVLRNVRWRTSKFADGFTFSPIGRTLLAHHDPEQ